MNFFHGNGMFGLRVGHALGAAAPRLGSVDPAMKAALDRIRADIGRLAQFYSRNAALPLEYRVTGPAFSQAADISDRLSKDVASFDQNPDDPGWSQPPPAQALATVDDLDNRITDLEKRLATAEVATKAAAAPPVPAPPAEVPAEGPVSTVGVILGIVVIAALGYVIMRD